MGATEVNCMTKVQSTNQNFISMAASPGSNSLITEVQVHSLEAYQKWMQLVQRLKEMKPECLLVPKDHKIIDKNLCGQSLRLEIAYECYYIQLSRQIAKRQEVQKYLEQTELWYLLYCLVSAAATCHHMDSPIGDVRPQNLFLSKDGTLKVLSKLSVPSRQETIAHLQSNKKGLFSPQQLQSIRKCYKVNNWDYTMCQSFSIGMTILSAGNIQNVSYCYDYHNSCLNMLEYNKLLTFWHQNEFYSQVQKRKIMYSKQLKDIIMRMVELNPQNRLNSLDVYQILQPHKKMIFALKPFQLKGDYKSVGSSRKQSDIFSTSSRLDSIHKLKSRKRSDKKLIMKSEGNMEGTKLFSHHYESVIKTPNIVKEQHESLNPYRKKKMTTFSNLKMTPQTFD